MRFVLAISPLLMILILMVLARWGAARAGAAGWLVSVAVAVLWFGAGTADISGAQIRGLVLSLEVLLIMWAAFIMYRLAAEAGAISDLSDQLSIVARDRVMQALLLGWGFASVLQGLGGFGVPVAVTAPILIELGFAPMAALVLPSLGHAWAITFGSLGASFQALQSASGYSAAELGLPAATMLGVLALGSGLGVLLAAAGIRKAARYLPGVVLTAIAMGVVQAGMVKVGLWNLGGVGGAAAGLLVLILLARRRSQGDAGRVLQIGELALALAPYLLLVGFVLLVQLVRPVRALLSAWQIGIAFPVAGVLQVRSLAPLSLSGVVLFYAAGAAYALYLWLGKLRPIDGFTILRDSWARLLPSTLGILSMLMMAMTMSHAGMTDRIAASIADFAGPTFPGWSPLIGSIGAFMTGSNTNSNAVLAELQVRTANLLDLSPIWILAGQTVGGAIGSVAAPAKLIVGASTAGLQEREGRILRGLLPWILPMLVVVGVVIVLATSLAPG